MPLQRQTAANMFSSDNWESSLAQSLTLLLQKQLKMWSCSITYFDAWKANRQCFPLTMLEVSLLNPVHTWKAMGEVIVLNHSLCHFNGKSPMFFLLQLTLVLLNHLLVKPHNQVGNVFSDGWRSCIAQSIILFDASRGNQQPIVFKHLPLLFDTPTTHRQCSSLTIEGNSIATSHTCAISNDQWWRSIAQSPALILHKKLLSGLGQSFTLLLQGQ